MYSHHGTGTRSRRRPGCRGHAPDPTTCVSADRPAAPSRMLGALRPEGGVPAHVVEQRLALALTAGERLGDHDRVVAGRHPVHHPAEQPGQRPVQQRHPEWPDPSTPGARRTGRCRWSRRSARLSRWPAPSRCTATCSARATSASSTSHGRGRTTPAAGRSDTDVNEVAVNPTGGSPAAVTTATVDACRRSSARRTSGSIGATCSVATVMASLRGKAGAQPAYGAMLAGGQRTGARNADQRRPPHVLVIKPWPSAPRCRDRTVVAAGDPAGHGPSISAGSPTCQLGFARCGTASDPPLAKAPAWPIYPPLSRWEKRVPGRCHARRDNGRGGWRV